MFAHIPFKLSEQALRNFKEIWMKQIGEAPPDEDLHAQAVQLLSFFKLLIDPQPKSAESEKVVLKVSEAEFKALKHIHNAVCHDSTQPTARSVAQAIGLKSSRSGMKMIDSLMARGLIYRSKEGKIEMREDAAGCEPQLKMHT